MKPKSIRPADDDGNPMWRGVITLLESKLVGCRYPTLSGGKPPFPTCELMSAESYNSTSTNLQVGKGGLPPLKVPGIQRYKQLIN
jgi:hypothetical protein